MVIFPSMRGKEKKLMRSDVELNEKKYRSMRQFFHDQSINKGS
jgi:hypothetical protein